jgi:hypothetical protein
MTDCIVSHTTVDLFLFLPLALSFPFSNLIAKQDQCSLPFQIRHTFHYPFMFIPHTSPLLPFSILVPIPRVRLGYLLDYLSNAFRYLRMTLL